MPEETLQVAAGNARFDERIQDMAASVTARFRYHSIELPDGSVLPGLQTIDHLKWRLGLFGCTFCGLDVGCCLLHSFHEVAPNWIITSFDTHPSESRRNYICVLDARIRNHIQIRSKLPSNNLLAYSTRPHFA